MMLTKYTKPFFRSVGNKYRPRRQCLFLCNANLQSLHFNNNNNNNHLYNNKRYLHFVSKEFLIDDVTIPLVDKISNEIIKIKSNDKLIFDNKLFQLSEYDMQYSELFLGKLSRHKIEIFPCPHFQKCGNFGKLGLIQHFR